MRKSIFDIISQNIDLRSEARRIVAMATEERILVVNGKIYWTLFKFVDQYCFEDWADRNHCLNVNDYLNTLNFNFVKRDAEMDVDSMLTLIELIYNFWILSYQKFDDDDMILEWCGNYYHLQKVMDDVLAQYNHIAYIDEENDRVLVIEDKPEITATAEIVPEELSLDVIKYNHRSLQGDVETKRTILVKLGAELEPKRKELQQLNKKLENNIFFMLNNLHIRHNNKNPDDSAKYKEYVAMMDADCLEEWYDELYQMILLAFLLLDDVEREESVDELKQKLVEVKN